MNADDIDRYNMIVVAYATTPELPMISFGMAKNKIHRYNRDLADSMRRKSNHLILSNWKDVENIVEIEEQLLSELLPEISKKEMDD